MSSVLGHRFGHPWLSFTVLFYLCFMCELGCGGDHHTDDTEDTLYIEVQCAGHGEIHEDHCHCDSGFTLSDDELSCVSIQQAVDQGIDAPDEGHQAHDMGQDQDAHHNLDMDHVPDMSQAHDLGEDHDQGDPGDMGGGDIEALMFMPTLTQASTSKGSDGKAIWLLEASGDQAMLSFENYESFGGPTSPGTFPITSTETNYMTCGSCLILRTGCVAHGDHVDCDHTFMPRAQGDVRLDAIGTQVGERLAGELVSLVFQEVSIDQDFQTLPVMGGEVLHLADWRFDVLLQGGEDEPECSGHGHLHGNQCHCDAGYRTDPQDSDRCVPE